MTPFWVTMARTTSIAASRVLELSALGLATSSGSTAWRPMNVSHLKTLQISVVKAVRVLCAGIRKDHITRWPPLDVATDEHPNARSFVGHLEATSADEGDTIGGGRPRNRRQHAQRRVPPQSLACEAQSGAGADLQPLFSHEQTTGKVTHQAHEAQQRVAGAILGT